MNLKLSFAAALVACMLLSGCASIVSGGGRQRISVKSDPGQAQITVTDDRGVLVLTTNCPCRITLSRGDVYRRVTYKVRFEKQGFEPQELLLRGGVNGWYFGNILFGGVIGFAVVDPITGAMWTLHPKKIDVKLAERTSVSSPGPATPASVSRQHDADSGPPEGTSGKE